MTERLDRARAARDEIQDGVVNRATTRLLDNDIEPASFLPEGCLTMEVSGREPSITYPRVEGHTLAQNLQAFNNFYNLYNQTSLAPSLMAWIGDPTSTTFDYGIGNPCTYSFRVERTDEGYTLRPHSEQGYGLPRELPMKSFADFLNLTLNYEGMAIKYVAKPPEQPKLIRLDEKEVVKVTLPVDPILQQLTDLHIMTREKATQARQAIRTTPSDGYNPVFSLEEDGKKVLIAKSEADRALSGTQEPPDTALSYYVFSNNAIFPPASFKVVTAFDLPVMRVILSGFDQDTYRLLQAMSDLSKPKHNKEHFFDNHWQSTVNEDGTP